ncbi:MAG: hypothetical protein IPG63_00775 [Xanthomonadales bacterium]|nr:hypothetical protein [Xanthomonadales bacterium]MBK7145384.1 hypothetical protein [Xanthomonadales bacterium]
MTSTLRCFTALCALALAACAGSNASLRSPTLDHVATLQLPDGHDAVLVREYDDEVKLGDGREQRMRVTYLWDYTAAVARERQTAPDGSLISDRLLPALTLNATDAELAYAVALLRQDAAIDARFTDDTDVYGGFSQREPGDQHCDLGSRCIHVIVSRENGRYKVAHAIVDLQRGRVVDPDYDPELGGIAESMQKAARQ